MYVSIDLQNMRLVHKHPSLDAVCALVYIELPDMAVDISAWDIAVQHKTEMEIKALFRSCFPKADPLPIAGMKTRILQFIEAFPVTDLDEIEVRRQSESIPEGDRQPYKYVKGSFRSSRPADLFTDIKAITRPQGSNASAPRSSGVREKVWAVADQMWEEAGKPKDKNMVLLLRRAIMSVLEQDGVKRTSSSNELGNWQKSRVS